jgi:hypothetical protein
MIPASLRTVLDKRNNEPRGIVTLTLRDGCVLREKRDGTWSHFTTVNPIDQPEPQEDDDNPFPP